MACIDVSGVSHESEQKANLASISNLSVYNRNENLYKTEYRASERKSCERSYLEMAVWVWARSTDLVSDELSKSCSLL